MDVRTIGTRRFEKRAVLVALALALAIAITLLAFQARSFRSTVTTPTGQTINKPPVVASHDPTQRPTLQEIKARKGR